MIDFYELLKYNGVPKRIRHVLRSKPKFPDGLPGVKEVVDQSLYVYGPLGCGKTTYAAYILAEIFRSNTHFPFYLDRLNPASEDYEPSFVPQFPYIFERVPVLLREIKKSFDRENGGPTEAEIVGRCIAAKLLVLDDLGVELTTDWAFQTMYTIIDERYNEMLPTIFTSNLSLDELDSKLGDGRLVSRIGGACETEGIIQITGDDRRIRT